MGEYADVIECYALFCFQ